MLNITENKKNEYSFLASARVTLEVIQDSPEIRMIRLSFILKWWNRGIDTMVPILLTRVWRYVLFVIIVWVHLPKPGSCCSKSTEEVVSLEKLFNSNVDSNWRMKARICSFSRLTVSWSISHWNILLVYMNWQYISPLPAIMESNIANIMDCW